MSEKKWIPLALLAVVLGGCEFHARSAEDYSAETKQLLASKSDEIKSCYDAVLAQDANAQGVVTVDFKVEAKTGNVVEPTIDEEKTTAPEPLHACVLNAVNGLSLDPPDAREGVAEFAYDFSANEPKEI